MSEELIEDQAKLKQGLIKVLQCVECISSAAAVVIPIFGVAGPLIRMVLNYVDNEDIEDIRALTREIGSVNQTLLQISLQNRDILLHIQKEMLAGQKKTLDGQKEKLGGQKEKLGGQKETLDGQEETLDTPYDRVEENLRSQFRKFMETVEAPERLRERLRERRKLDFKESYANDLGDQNLRTLYIAVVGKSKLFSQPVLEVYLKHSHGDRATMEKLCTRLTYLFCIGLIALMGYTAVIDGDEEGLREEWAEKMELVQEKMQEALRRCK